MEDWKGAMMGQTRDGGRVVVSVAVCVWACACLAAIFDYLIRLLVPWLCAILPLSPTMGVVAPYSVFWASG